MPPARLPGPRSGTVAVRLLPGGLAGGWRGAGRAGWREWLPVWRWRQRRKLAAGLTLGTATRGESGEERRGVQ